MLFRLKQSLIEKEYSNRFTEVHSDWPSFCNPTSGSTKMKSCKLILLSRQTHFFPLSPIPNCKWLIEPNLTQLRDCPPNNNSIRINILKATKDSLTILQPKVKKLNSMTSSSKNSKLLRQVTESKTLSVPKYFLLKLLKKKEIKDRPPKQKISPKRVRMPKQIERDIWA